MRITETKRIALVRKLIDNNWMHNIAWEYNDAKNARRGTGHLRGATGVSGAGHMRINKNNRTALARKIIDSNWMHRIALDNIEVMSARGRTGHLRCAIGAGRMRISETERIALGRTIIDSTWMHNIAGEHKRLPSASRHPARQELGSLSRVPPLRQLPNRCNCGP